MTLNLVNMKRIYIYLIGAIVLFGLGFFAGYCTSQHQIETKVIEVPITIPEFTPEVKTIINPTANPSTGKGKISIKDEKAFSEDPRNADLVDALNNLKTSDERYNLLLKEAELMSYTIPYDDDRQHAEYDITSRGKVLDFTPRITYKEQTFTVPVEVEVLKPKEEKSFLGITHVFGGGGASAQTAPVSNFSAHAAAAFQFKNDNILIGGYNTDRVASFTYLIQF
jgi:hypothetical protein